MFEQKEKIIQDFSKYWEMNDEAHRLKHFSNVEECAGIINHRADLRFDHVMITYAAFFHDMFAWSRYNHHEMSAHWVLTTDYPLIANLLDTDKKMLASACRQHRASFSGKFDNKFAELMNAADRELPGDVPAMVERAILYRMGKGYSREEALKPSIEHIKDKFGISGYARYPQIYLDVFEADLLQQRQDVANL